MVEVHDRSSRWCGMIPLRAMPPLVRYEVRDRVAVVTVDNPPVNALGAGVPEALSEAVERACDDSNADAIVLIGAGTTFIGPAWHRTPPRSTSTSSRGERPGD